MDVVPLRMSVRYKDLPAMALCIYNHLSDGLHRKFIGFPALQPFDFCPKPDVP